MAMGSSRLRDGAIVSTVEQSKASHDRADRVVDIAAVVLISATVVLSAICGNQSGRWSGYATFLYNSASANRSRANEARDTENELRSIDIGIFVQYINAFQRNDTALAQFYQKRFRPEARPAIDAWSRMHPLKNPDAPPTPFTMPQYRGPLFAESRRLESLATADFTAAHSSEDTAEQFLLLTVIFAAVSFMAGICTKLGYPRHLVVVTVGCAALLYGIVRLASLPFR
jgi:hypothetical protein